MPDHVRQRLTQRPLFLGVDGEAAAHYWDSYERALVIVKDTVAEKVELTEIPFKTLGQWCEYTREERGWAVGPHVDGSLVGELVRGPDA
ncbi:hypothetical protein ACFQJ5_16885 [Halomicroarcula sp. GCM10025324]|uniref:hypothetical protein n=1 Tax=Haloarcula TaxID=2237 RepID=UPI0023E84FFC|nr:hypothetical protein [Halomicroarcula sp. ZS-22-S1]